MAVSMKNIKKAVKIISKYEHVYILPSTINTYEYTHVYESTYVIIYK